MQYEITWFDFHWSSPLKNHSQSDQIRKLLVNQRPLQLRLRASTVYKVNEVEKIFSLLSINQWNKRISIVLNRTWHIQVRNGRHGFKNPEWNETKLNGWNYT